MAKVRDVIKRWLNDYQLDDEVAVTVFSVADLEPDEDDSNPLDLEKLARLSDEDKRQIIANVHDNQDATVCCGWDNIGHEVDAFLWELDHPNVHVALSTYGVDVIGEEPGTLYYNAFSHEHCATEFAREQCPRYEEKNHFSAEIVVTDMQGDYQQFSVSAKYDGNLTTVTVNELTKEISNETQEIG